LNKFNFAVLYILEISCVCVITYLCVQVRFTRAEAPTTISELPG